MDTSVSIFHSFSGDKHEKLFTPVFFVIIFIFIVLGVATGYLLVQTKTTKVSPDAITPSSVSAGTAYGSDDMATFKDTVEGKLAVGGMKDEGQYHLVRSGGDSQNVYLTSSLVDLSKFVGHTVKIWGQTQKAQYAGWLMDVGKVEVKQ